MKVRAELEPQYARQDAESGAEIGVLVSFEHDGLYYPGKGWNDFGFRLLGFWLQQILLVKEGRTKKPEFTFLDGDFCLTGSLDDAGTVELVPRRADVEFAWRLQWPIVEGAIIAAAKSLRLQAAELGLEPPGVEGLDEGLRRLVSRM